MKLHRKNINFHYTLHHVQMLTQGPVGQFSEDTCLATWVQSLEHMLRCKKITPQSRPLTPSPPAVNSVGCALLPQHEHIIEKRPDKSPKYYTSRRKIRNFHDLRVGKNFLTGTQKTWNLRENKFQSWNVCPLQTCFRKLINSKLLEKKSQSAHGTEVHLNSLPKKWENTNTTWGTDELSRH